MAPIDHLFDDHGHCDSSWCHKKAIEEKKIKYKEVGSERSREGYYRCKVKDKELYESLCDLYEPYITEERIGQCKHEFETQVNEGMNTCVAKYAPKGRHYSKTISLEARVKVAAGIYNIGYHFFWTEVMKELGINIEPSVEEYLLKKDLDKLRKFNRDHDHTNMAKRKAMEHDKLRKELEIRYKNIAKNMEYSPMVGCGTTVDGVNKSNSKANQKICKHKLYGLSLIHI